MSSQWSEDPLTWIRVRRDDNFAKEHDFDKDLVKDQDLDKDLADNFARNLIKDFARLTWFGVRLEDNNNREHLHLPLVECLKSYTAGRRGTVTIEFAIKIP